MTILDALVKLRDDLKTWCTNNFNMKLNKNLGAQQGNKFLVTNTSGEITTTDITSVKDEIVTDINSNVQTQIDSMDRAKADSVHSHSASDITDLQGILDTKVAQSELDSLRETVSNKANINHSHTILDVEGLQSSLDAKSPLSHTHTTSDIADLQNSLDGIRGYVDSVAEGKSNVTHNHDDVYDRIGTAANALDEAKFYINQEGQKIRNATGNSVRVAIEEHNSKSDAHQDIRGEVATLTAKVNNLLDVDTDTFNQLTEMITLIDTNADELQTLTNGKVNVTDIVDNLETNNSTQVLSAAQGVVVKGLIDELTLNTNNALDEKADKSHTHLFNDITDMSLAKFGINANADELNKLQGVTATTEQINCLVGVTSSIQDQLDNKSNEGHTHNYAGSSSVGGSATSAEKLDVGTVGSTTQPVYFADGVPVATSYTLGKSVPSDAQFTDTVYMHPTESGYKHIPTGGQNGQILRCSGNGTATWSDEQNTTYGNATTSTAGLMSASDKVKLDGISKFANAYILPQATYNTLGGVKTTSTVTSNSGYTACPIIDGVPYYKDTKNTYSLDSFGVTATADELNKLDGITVTTTELNCLDGVTSNIQAQMNSKQSTITGAATTITSSNLTINRALISNGSGKVVVSDITTTELGCLDGVTSNIQAQMNSKQSTITGAATTITSSNLTGNRVLVSSASGKVIASTVDGWQLSYLSGVTSNIQEQLDEKATLSHQHNATDITGTLSSDRLPTVPISKGGTGATTAVDALNNLGITNALNEKVSSSQVNTIQISQTDLTAGVSSLATGVLYFVYE